MKKNEIMRLIKKVTSMNRIKKVYLFGSFTKKRKNYGDIDIAIEAPPGFTLLDLSRVANVLEKEIGISVDLITLKGLNPKLKKIIKKEMVAL